MPIYEYECPLCEDVVEIEHKINEQPNPWPICKHDPEKIKDVTVYGVTDLVNTQMRRIISKNSFSLKGSGWARDKYGK